MADEINICNQLVSLATFDFGASYGFPQPHFRVQVRSLADSSNIMLCWKWSKRLKLGGILKSVSADEVSILENLGSGSFGSVWRGTLNEEETSGSTSGSKTVAIKKLKPKPNQLQEDIAFTFLEAAVMSVINHPNIIRFVSLVMKSDEIPWILLEHASNGSLFKVLTSVQEELENDDKLPEYWTDKTKVGICLGIIRGLNYLHCHQCLHRDLTPRNILLDEKYEAKLCDFGLTTFVEGELTIEKKGESGKSVRKSGDAVRRSVYSLLYCPPEAFPKGKLVPENDLTQIPNSFWVDMGLMSVKEYLAHLHEEQNDDQEEPQLLQIDPMGLYDYRSDIWALGVVIHQIFIDGKYIPYRNTEDDLDVEEIKTMIDAKKNPCHFVEIDGQKYPRIKKILEKMFKYNRKRRPSAPTLKKFFEQEIELYEASSSTPVQK